MEFSRRTLIAMSSAALFSMKKTAPASGNTIYERGYVPCRFRQMHSHVVRPADPSNIRMNPIACLHPSPASGRYFLDLLEIPGRNRLAYAFDTPGYGESDRPATK